MIKEEGGKTYTYSEGRFDWVFDTQKIFRCLMEGLAFPGKVIQMPELSLSPPEPRMKYVMGALLTLLDREVSFCVWGPDAEETKKACRYIRVNTGSLEKFREEADYVLFLGPSEGKIRQVNPGELEAPHRGAMVFYLIKALSEGVVSRENAGVTFRLNGPGVKGERHITVEGIEPTEVDLWIENRQEYPFGVDIYLITPDGCLCGLPRSSKILY